MDPVNQISVKIFEDYTASEANNIIYVDSTPGPIDLTLIRPENSDSILIQDLGDASSNNISLASTQLINGENGFTIDKDFGLIELTYEPIEGFYTAKELSGYQIVISETTLDASATTVYVDSSAGGFTIFLNPEPRTNDEVHVVDYVGSCGSNAVTVDGSGKLIVGLDDALMNIDFMAYNFKYNSIQYNI